MSSTDAKVRHAHGNGTDALSYITQVLDIPLGNVLSTVHTQLDYGRVCACWVPMNLTHTNKAHCVALSLMHVTHYTHEEVQFLHCLVNRE